MMLAAGVSRSCGGGVGSGARGGAARARRRGNGDRSDSEARVLSGRDQVSSNGAPGSVAGGSSRGRAGGSLGGDDRKSVGSGSAPRFSARSRSRREEEANSKLRLGRSAGGSSAAGS